MEKGCVENAQDDNVIQKGVDMRKIMIRTALLIGSLTSVFLSGSAAIAQSADTLAAQRNDYDEVRAKTIVELQPFRHEMQAQDSESGQYIELLNLNPAINAWFLLNLRADVDAKPDSYHLENLYPETQTMTLEPGASPAILLTRNGQISRCKPWDRDNEQLQAARATGLAYAKLCGGTVFLRNKVSGARTNIEAAAEFLRENVWGGESIVRFVRDSFFKDSQIENSEILGDGVGGASLTGPRPMLGNKPPEDMPTISTLLDIGLEGTEHGRMTVGRWYQVASLPGIFASAFQPGKIAEEVLEGPGKTNRLDSVEAKATGYMVAFDLDQFTIGYAVGTDHPALGWSPRPAASARPRGLPGPDGIKSASPLVLLGMINPVIANKSVATFTAGFKRRHGAFKFGDMATYNYGHHYGFIEKGVILSKLQPNLSTLFGLTDGSIHMRTWTAEDDALLPEIAFARQNGVPLLETDPETGLGIPGDRVTKWGPGNWSGSAKAELRTLRAGACIADSSEKRFLLYGYFSTATPSAMARTFQAYGCNYAMLLDMNALEHTYLALYAQRDNKLHVEHMVPGMALIEKKASGGTIIPRFIGFADNRDLFYVTRKEQ